MALVPFVIDTGASRSCIHARDARDRFGARRSLLETLPWRQAVRIGGVGGAARALDVPAEFIFRHEDTRIESIFANVLIGDLSTENLPSLLGMDILQKFDLRVHPNNITLERVEV